MDKMGVLSFDENNNETFDAPHKRSLFIERHVEIGGEDDFLIIPNGGSGDCMFKAVSQAVFEGDESKHKEVRQKVVNFITSEKWEKFSESIEVQHINGNNLLQRQWAKNPRQAYKMYMSLDGTLGSSSELTAAGELFQYNFATIQEYNNADQRTYRVENCILFNDRNIDFHYFYFTGDFDNGHWEYIRSTSGQKLGDGTYRGRYKTLIDDEEISVEDWLRRETENDNEAMKLKIPTDRALHSRGRRSLSNPFGLNNFHFAGPGTLRLKGTNFNTANVESTDLFSVLAQECMQNESSAHEMEITLMKHRYSYFEDLNYKLITQPWSHSFTTEAIKYCGYPCKGNIQDLISAADLYSFSFILYLRLCDDLGADDIHSCKFTHVDRWGGESDRLLHFFMRLTPSEQTGQFIAKWWRLIPLPPGTPLSRPRSAPRQRAEVGDFLASISPRNSSNTRNSQRPPTRPSSASTGRGGDAGIMLRNTASRLDTPRPKSASAGKSISFSGCLERDFENLDEAQEEQKCLMEDCQKIFGTSFLSPNSSMTCRSQMNFEPQKGGRLVQRRPTSERSRRATGSDLLMHPEKVKTVVKVRDRNNNSTRSEVVYSGTGYMRADDVLSDLKSQGLIKFPQEIKKYSKPPKPKRSGMEDLEPRDWDENNNLIEDDNEDLSNEEVESASDISFEKFVDRPMKKREMNRPDVTTGAKFKPKHFPYGTNNEVSEVKINKVTPQSNFVVGDYAMDENARLMNSLPNFVEKKEEKSCGFWLRRMYFKVCGKFDKLHEKAKRELNERKQHYQNSTSFFSAKF